jgi:hypothetical protein
LIALQFIGRHLLLSYLAQATECRFALIGLCTGSEAARRILKSKDIDTILPEGFTLTDLDVVF